MTVGFFLLRGDEWLESPLSTGTTEQQTAFEPGKSRMALWTASIFSAFQLAMIDSA
jgi:hypothetical protein